MSLENSSSEKIAIIGTGNYGLSIGKRLLHYGFSVVYGSRKPNLEYVQKSLNLDENSVNLSVTSIVDAWDQSDGIVILAISAEESIYNSLAEDIVKNSNNKNPRILIEISNLSDSIDLKNLKESNAKKLNELFKSKIELHNKQDVRISIVKAFNLINSYSFSSFLDENEKSSLISSDLAVPIAGDDEISKQKIINFCSKIGLRGFDLGDLEKGALKLELSNKQTFSNWKLPSLLSILFLIFNFVWTTVLYYFFSKKPVPFEQYIKNFSILGHLNKVFGFTALYLLSFVYLAYGVASIYQLKYSTKYKKFPYWLDCWLKTRKQFGLWAFLFASFHAIISSILTDPFYMKTWYTKTENGIGKMTLNGELNILFGVTAYVLMVLVALSSINSIANSLNWSEWRFVQSKLGLSCLAMALTHDVAMYFRIFNEPNNDVVYLLTRVKLIAIYFPLVVLILRFLFSFFRPISQRLEKIRNGTIVSSSA